MKIWSLILRFDGDALDRRSRLKDEITRQIGTYIICGSNVQARSRVVAIRTTSTPLLPSKYLSDTRNIASNPPDSHHYANHIYHQENRGSCHESRTENPI